MTRSITKPRCLASRGSPVGRSQASSAGSSGAARGSVSTGITAVSLPRPTLPWQIQACQTHPSRFEVSSEKETFPASGRYQG